MKDLNSNLPLAGKSFKPLVATSLALALGVSVLSAQNIGSGSTEISTGNSGTSENYGVLMSGTTSVTIAGNNATVTKAYTGTDAFSGLLVNNGAVITFNNTAASKLTLSGLASGDYVIKNANSTSATTLTLDAVTSIIAGTATGGQIASNVSGALFAFGSGSTAYTKIDGGTASANAGADITGLALSADSTLSGNLGVIGQVGASDNNGGSVVGMSVDSTSGVLNIAIADNYSLIAQGGNGGSASTSATNGGAATGMAFAGSNAINLVSSAADNAQSTITLGVRGGNAQAQGNTTGTNGVATAIQNGTILSLDNVALNVYGLRSGDTALNNTKILQINGANAHLYFDNTTQSTLLNTGVIASNVAGVNFILGNTSINGGVATSTKTASAITGMYLTADTALSGSLNVIGQSGGSTQVGGNVVGIDVVGNATANQYTTFTLNSALNLNVVGGSGSTQGSATAISIASNNAKFAGKNAIAELNLTSQDADGKTYAFTAIDNKGTLAFENVSILSGKTIEGTVGDVTQDVRSFADIALINNAVDTVYNFGASTTMSLSSAIASASAGRNAVGMFINESATFSGTLAQTITAQGANAGGTAGDVYAIVGGNSSILSLADSSSITINATAGSITSTATPTTTTYGNAYGIFVENGTDGSSNFTIAPSGTTGVMSIALTGNNVTAIDLVGSDKGTLPINVVLDKVTFNQINASQDIVLINNASSSYSSLTLGSEAFGSAVGASSMGGSLTVINNAGNLTLGGTLSVGGGTISNPVRMYHNVNGGVYNFGSNDLGTTVASLATDSASDHAYGFAIANNATIGGNLTFAGITHTQNAKNVYGTYVGSNTGSNTALTLNADVNLAYNNLSTNSGLAYGLYLKGNGTSINGANALNVVANGSGSVSALGLDTINFSGYDKLTLSASSASGDAIAIDTTGTTTIATTITIDSVNADNGVAYALKNRNGTLTFAANNLNSVARIHTGLGATTSEQYAIYHQAGINAGYDFGTSTVFNAIEGETSLTGQFNGQNATWMMLGGEALISGTATVNAIQAGNGSFSSAEGTATNGGNAYGLLSLNDNATILFNDKAQGKITFAQINAGVGGQGYDANGGLIQGVNGDAAGIYINQNSLSILGGSSTYKGQIIFSNIGASSDNNIYVINNVSETNKTLSIGGYAQIFAGAATGDAMINNNIANAIYNFGSGSSYTNLSIENNITGIALNADATLSGNLKAQGVGSATIISLANDVVLNNNALAITAQGGTGNLVGITTSGNASINLNGVMNADLLGGDNNGAGATISGIALTGSNTLNVTNGTLRINATAGEGTGTNAEGKAYIINNTANTSVLNFDETSSLVAGNASTLNVANTLGYKFGLYSDTKAAYNFGTTNFNVVGAAGSNATENSAASKGGDAVGIVLAQSTTFGGTLNQTITGGTGGNGTQGMGGDATGIVVLAGKNVALTLDSGAAINLNVIGGNGGSGASNGNATGLSVNGGKFSVSGNGLNFAIGSQSTTKAVGIALNNAVLNGSMTFSSIQSSSAASGLEVSGSSVLNSGTLTFNSSAFSVNDAFNVINNTGTLTITKNASIVAGSKTINQNVGIFNSIAGANYNLGNLNLATSASDNGAFAIYSSDATSQFNVAAGSTLDLSVVDMGSNPSNTSSRFVNSYIFGGKVNLSFDSGAQSNVYLNANGGTLASLKAAENTTIYLSGKSKAARVGLANTVQFRSLTINEMQSSYVNANSTTLNPDQIYSGANFVVLASREKMTKGANSDAYVGSAYNSNGSRYNATTQSYNAGGSDRIIVNNANVSNGMSKINNTLSIGLSDISTSKEQKYVVLAQVSDEYTPILGGGADRLHNVVTFNGLMNSGDSTFVESNVGFDVATLEIQRHDLGTEEKLNLSSTNNGEDWSSVGAVYVSDLVARDLKVDQNYADSSTAAISTNFNLVSANLNSLSKRMGELRNTDNTQGVWGRIFAGQQTSDFGLEQTSTYTTFQVGYDYKTSLENASNYTGLALSYVYSMSKQASANYLADDGVSRISGNSSSTTHGMELALYNSYIADSGFYSDSIVKFGYFASDLNIPAQTDTYKTNNMSITVSEEVGYRIKFGGESEWFIDPQAELAYAFINSSNFTQTLGSGASLETEQDATSMLRTRVGAAWGYSFDHLSKEKEIKASLYLGTYYAYDYIAGGDVHLTTNNGTQSTVDALKSNGRFVLNVGTDVAFKDNAKVYVDFEKSFGGSMRTDYQLSLGVRYSFGSKTANAEASKDEASTPALKPKSLDENK